MQLIEICEVVRIKKTNLEKLYFTTAVFEKVESILAKEAIMSLMSLIGMKTSLDAEESYLNILKSSPEFFEDIPQLYMVSYMGIQPQSLSRIRKRIFDK